MVARTSTILFPVGTRRAVSFSGQLFQRKYRFLEVPLRLLRCKRPTGTFAKFRLLQKGNRGKRSCSLSPRKAVAFLTPFLRGAIECAGVFRRLRAATRDAVPGLCQGSSPWTSPAFLKNCWIKKLHCRLRRSEPERFPQNCAFKKASAVLGESLFYVYSLGQRIRS